MVSVEIQFEVAKLKLKIVVRNLSSLITKIQSLQIKLMTENLLNEIPQNYN